MTTTEILLWDVLPYVAITTFIVGTIWRYRYDKFGWTTRSSQLYERKLMRIASPLFHLGILAVLVGHIVGLLIPNSWTDAAGLSEDTYHLMAVGLGAVAGAATLAGVALLVYRRRTNGPVFAATTKNDKTMYIFLVAAICLGLLTTLVGSGVIGNAFTYGHKGKQYVGVLSGIGGWAGVAMNLGMTNDTDALGAAGGYKELTKYNAAPGGGALTVFSL